MFEYVVINTKTNTVVTTFEAVDGNDARRRMVMFNDDCKLYTAGKLNEKEYGND